MKDKKPCEPDEIRNPATGRCVKRTGAKGKEILRAQQQQKQPSPTSPIYHTPVKKSPTKQSLTKQSPIYHTPTKKSPTKLSPTKTSPNKQSNNNNAAMNMSLEVKKRTSNVQITFTGRPGKYSLVLTASVAMKKALHYKDPISATSPDEITARYNQLKDALLQLGYKIILEKKTIVKPPSPKTDASPRKAVDINKCRNKTTLIMANRLENVEDRNNIIMLSSGNCYLVDEIAQFWKAGTLKDPLNLSYSITDQDINNVVGHKNLSPALKKDIDKILASKEGLLNILRDNPGTSIPYVRAVIATGLLCLTNFDKENSYPVATTAIGGLQTFVDERMKAMKDVCTLTDLAGNSVQSILSDDTLCIHAKGSSLLSHGLFLAHKVNVADHVPMYFMHYFPDLNAYVMAFSRTYKGELTSVANSLDLIYEAVIMGESGSASFIRIGFLNKLNGNFLPWSRESVPQNHRDKVKTIIERSTTVYVALRDKVMQTNRTVGNVFTELFAMLGVTYPDPDP